MENEDGAGLLNWAPRVACDKVARLYASDAAGMVDEDLLAEVAYAFYWRCMSIIEVTDAEWGTIHCPACRVTFQRPRGDDPPLICPACRWQTTWRAFLKTYQHQQLSGGGAIGAFRGYVEKFPGAQTAQERMLLVDRLVHEVHASIQKGTQAVFYRPAAVNLLDANMTYVTAFLEALANNPGYSPSIRASQEAWKENILPRFWPRR